MTDHSKSGESDSDLLRSKFSDLGELSCRMRATSSKDFNH
jgi:hypothetical protein